LDDSLCVLASSGAIQLEHQFTGEKMIVPQAGEFFLNAGKLVPVAGTPGSCKCSANGPGNPAIPPSPQYANVGPPPAQPIAIPPASSASGSAPAAVEVTPSPAEKSVEYAQLAQANQEHPVAPAPRNERSDAPPSSPPAYTAVLPALTYNAPGPAPPPTSSSDMVLLVREARVSPDWEFSGHVEPPEFAKAMQHALGEGAPVAKKPPATGAAVTENQNPGAGASAAGGETASIEEPAPKKRHGGFWASLKRVFGG
jgi:hypothetical protein